MYLNINKIIPNIKFPNVISINNLYYIYGIKSEKVSNNVNKFVIFFDIYNKVFEFKERRKINLEFKESTLIWDIVRDGNIYIFIIEQKSININKHQSTFFKYYIKDTELENFNISKIEKIQYNNILISKIYKNQILAAKIEIDEERPDYYWGKYLFYFQDEKKEFYRPKFDNIVNYTKDKGHILHYLEKLDKSYLIIFSIRHKDENDNHKYYYKIYSAYSENLKYFHNTQEIKIDNNLTNAKWYCYPEIIKLEEKYIVLLNQDDFGKKKPTLVGELIIE